MVFVLFLILGFIYSFLLSLIQKNKLSKPKFVLYWLIHTFYLNIFSLSIFKLFIHSTKIFYLDTFMKFGYIYLIIFVCIALIYSILLHFGKKIIIPQPSHINQKQTTKYVLITLLFLLSSSLFVFTLWFLNFYGALTPDQFLFNMFYQVKGTTSEFNDSVSSDIILNVLILFSLFIPLFWTTYHLKISQRIYQLRKKRFVLSIFTGLFFVYNLIFTFSALKLKDVYNAYFNDSSYIKDHYIFPTNDILKFPEKKKNLIHIYLESMESSYFDKQNGGNMEENLMPDLLELSKLGIHFSNKETMGGPLQVYGTGYSVASMINMTTGLPLKVETEQNEYGKNGNFLPGVVNLGDILEEQGYNQMILLGSDSKFGGISTYFTSHGHYQIFDWPYAIEHGYLPKGYKEWWGFEDAKLYEFSKEQLTKLASQGKPFCFVTETEDTHFEDGYLDKNAPHKYDDKFSNVISYSQQQITEFVHWIMEQPFYEDTVIVLTGDHLSMDLDFFNDFPKTYQRGVFNLFINPSFKNKNIQTKNRKFTNMDFFPTILSSMGVEIKGDRLGLGTDLSSTTQTIMEQEGVDTFKDSLVLRSNFYNKTFLKPRK